MKEIDVEVLTPDDINLNISADEDIPVQFDTVINGGGTNDYNRLKNIPTLNGQPLIGNINESDPTVPEWAKQPGKPTYTPEEIKAINQDAVITLAEIDEMFSQIFE